MSINEQTVKILETITRDQWEAIAIMAEQMATKPLEKPSTESESKKTDDNTLHVKVAEVVKSIGVPPHIKGYKYLQEAIMMTYADETYGDHMTKRLYPDIAKRFHTTPSRVERAIRHAIEVAFEVGDPAVHARIFCGHIDGKPTNSHVIAALTEHVKLYM